MTIENLKETIKGWVNPSTGVERFYIITTSKQFRKARVFFSETREKARYTWKVEGKGFFHAEKSYNGWVEKDLKQAFPEEKIGTIQAG